MSNRLCFWLCVAFGLLNTVGFVSTGSLFSLAVAVLNLVVAYRLKEYA